MPSPPPLHPTILATLSAWVALTATKAPRKPRPKTPPAPTATTFDPNAGQGNPHGLPSGKPIANLIKTTLEGQRKEIRAWLKAQPTNILPVIPPGLDHWTDRLAADLEKRLTPYWTEAGRATLAALGRDAATWDAADPAVRRAIRDRATFAAESIVATTQQALTDAFRHVREADPPGTIKDLDRAVRDVFGRAIEHRTKVVAATEASDAVHGAALVAAKNANARSKAWLVDGRPCQICIDNASAGSIPIDRPFPSGHQAPTAHPFCYCSVSILGSKPATQPRPKPTPKPKPTPLPLDLLPPVVPLPEVVPQPVALPAFGPSQARVTHVDLKESFVLKEARKVFGRDVTLADLASAIGAPDDAHVNLSGDARDGMTVVMTGPGYRAERTLVRGPGKAGPTIRNENIEIDPDRQGQGLGTTVFGRQVEQATRLGVSRIETYAAKSEKYFGYAVWPKMGYDGKFPVQLLVRANRGEIPPPPGEPKQISDLMRTPEGRAWWTAHGVATELAFDLKEGSLSRRNWDAYRAERLTRVSPAIPVPPRPDPKPKPAPPPPPPPPPPLTSVFRDFGTDRAAMGQWARESFPDWKPSLTRDERSFLRNYKGATYKDINQYFRDPSVLLNRYEPEELSLFAEYAVGIDTGLAKAQLPEDVILWRGMRGPEHLGNVPLESLVGGTIQDEAYWSTSLSREQSSAFATSPRDNGILFKILAREGQPAAPLDLVEEANKEDEFLLPRGTTFRVLAHEPASRDAEGRYVPPVLTLEVAT